MDTDESIANKKIKKIPLFWTFLKKNIHESMKLLEKNMLLNYNENIIMKIFENVM